MHQPSNSRGPQGIAAALALLMLAGCGGGGGGGNSQAPGGGTTTPAPGTQTPAATFTVGVTVSGLAGTGLTLQNNGGDSLAIGSNGAFTFQTALASGATYNVSVTAQPTGPAQSCVVTSGNGTITANITNITVVCTTTPVSPTAGVWTQPQQISAETGDASTPQVAYDSNGNALAVWSEAGGSGRRILASRYEAASGTWAPPVPIDTTPVSNYASTLPQVAFDTTGNAFAAWQRTGGPIGQTTNDVWVNRYDAASLTWGTAQAIGAPNIGGVAPDVAAGGNGTAAVVWGNSQNLSETTWASVYDGTQWSTATVISDPALNALPPPTIRCQQPPQVAVNGDGEALAVWCHNSTVAKRIYASRYTSAMGAPSWRPAVQIDSPSGTATILNPDLPQLAFAGDGAAIALWATQSILGFKITTSFYDTATDTWSRAQFIDDQPVADRNAIIRLPSLAANADGSAVATWLSGSTLNMSAYVDTLAPGTGSRPWSGTSLLVDAAGNRAVTSLALALDALGNATVVWNQFNRDGVLRAVRFTQDTYTTASNTEVMINPDGRTAGPAAVIAYQDGSALAVWPQNTSGSGDHIWSSRLNVLPTGP